MHRSCEAEFSEPLKFVKESVLLENGRRVRESPPEIDWVLEGRAAARVEVRSALPGQRGAHFAFWSIRSFPPDFLLEFGVMPNDPDQGLNIVVLAATVRDGRSILDLG